MKNFFSWKKDTSKYSNNNDDFYNNFDIKVKEPIHKLSLHSESILSATILNDERFVTCSKDKSIIIYNKTFQPDLRIKEHSDWVRYVTQLSSGVLASCSDDKTIKLYNITNNEYKVLQILDHHEDYVYKVIELNN